MNLIKVERNHFEGEYRVYDLAVDPIGDIPVINGNWRTLKVGDWVCSCERLVCQVLEVIYTEDESSIHKSLIHTHVSIVTPFGKDALGRFDNKGRYYWNRLELTRKRVSFSSLRKHGAEGFLSIREKFFLIMGFQHGFDKAALMIKGESLSASKVDTMLRKALSRQDSKEYLMNEMKEELQKRGMDNVGWYLDKIDKTLEDGVHTPTHLVLFKNLANIANIPDVNNLVNPELSSQFSSGGLIPIQEGKKIEEGTFTEIKDSQTNEELKV